jgi:CubicO group peptidase (beta-lactamase class C family)
LAKIGQLLLDDCNWRGQQIISAQWCQLATSAHVPSQDVGHERMDLSYGYYFWVLPNDEAFAAWGHGGQFVLVVPSERLVLVQIARPDSQDLNGGVLEDFYELMSPLWR